MQIHFMEKKEDKLLDHYVIDTDKIGDLSLKSFLENYKKPLFFYKREEHEIFTDELAMYGAYLQENQAKDTVFRTININY